MSRDEPLRDTVRIVDAQSAADLDTARALFEEYASGLDIDLTFQHFSVEIERIGEIYGPPGGCVLLAVRGGAAAGCVAVRPFHERTCEMKRLYVRPAERGQGVGRLLAGAIVERARSRGYTRMVLDTLASMSAARTLYEALGFRQVPSYYANPLSDAVYYALDLQGPAGR